jgi:hypothetical protein
MLVREVLLVQHGLYVPAIAHLGYNVCDFKGICLKASTAICAVLSCALMCSCAVLMCCVALMGCAVLMCCAVLCCAVLCCAVLCCAS